VRGVDQEVAFPFGGGFLRRVKGRSSNLVAACYASAPVALRKKPLPASAGTGLKSLQIFFSALPPPLRLAPAQLLASASV
jgi:hypothetical protein